MANLLKEIQAATTESNYPLANVLRKCAVLASQIKNSELRDWVFKELNGYDNNTDTIPKYRVLGASVQGNLAGPFNSGYKNIMLPAACLPEPLQKQATAATFDQPIASLEALVASDSGDGQVVFNWPGNWVALIQKEGKLAEDVVLYGAWQSVSSAAIVGILDTVRNRVLEFCLRLENEVPGAGSDDVKPTTAETEATTQLFQTIIIGNHAGNIANASPGAIQTVHVVERGDLQGLVAALTRYGVPASEIDELRGVVEEEKNLTAIGPKASQWLAKASTAVASGTWKLGHGVSVGVITKAILEYYGIG